MEKNKMKRIIVFFLITGMVFILFSGCAANSTTGSITTVNYTDIDAVNAKIGDVYIGYVAKGGGISTVYFFSTQSIAAISVDKFKPFNSSLFGIIDLKPGYQYNLTLRKIDSSTYQFIASGKPVGKDTAITSDNINMK
jgi:hypothetical protein